MYRIFAIAAVGLLTLSAHAEGQSEGAGPSEAWSVEKEIHVIALDRHNPTHTAHQDLAYNVQFPPSYPSTAAAAGHYGTALIMVLVGADGAIRSVTIEQSTGFRDLDISALNAVKHWHFFPAARDGVAVEGYVRVPVSYGLHGPAPQGGQL